MDQPGNKHDDEHQVNTEDDGGQGRPNGELGPPPPHRKGMAEWSQPETASLAAS